MTRLTRWFRFASAARLATQLIALGKLLRKYGLRPTRYKSA